MEKHIEIISNAIDRFSFQEYLTACEELKLQPLELPVFACLVGKVVVGLQMGGNVSALDAYNSVNSNAEMEYKIPAESRGFGDTIAKITSAVGIKPCGSCKERQATLNKWLPYE